MTKLKLFSPAFVFMMGCTNIVMPIESRLHYSITETNRQPIPSNWVLLGNEIEVEEISKGNIRETLLSWSALARANINKELKPVARNFHLKLFDLPALSDTESEIVNKYSVLYHLMIYSIVHHIRGEETWQHKINKFDYSIGNGLNFLRTHGIDAALFIAGRQSVIWKNRGQDATRIINISGKDISMGQMIIIMGLVDLSTGNFLWFNVVDAIEVDLRNPSDVNEILAKIFKEFAKTELIGLTKTQRPD